MPTRTGVPNATARAVMQAKRERIMGYLVRRYDKASLED